jgi:hypothetical protein
VNRTPDATATFKMDEFKEYLRFPEIEKATEYTSVLDKHNIPYFLDDSRKRAKIISVAIDDPWSDQYILKLKESDIERAEKAFNDELDNEVKLINHEHYLYSFADNDIVDMIANQADWTKEEVKLATKIANERKLDLSAATLKSFKKMKEEAPKRRLTIQNTAGWFWTIGLFSIVNSIFLRKQINFHLPGLAITEIFESIAAKVSGEGNRFGFIEVLFISAVFFLFARFGKENKWVFLAGLIIYFLDSILVFASPRWGQILFIFIALWSMITGLVNTFKDEEKLRPRSA